MIKIGCVIILMLRLVIVRYWNMSFVGGWREDIFGRVIRIRVLFNDVVRMRRMFVVISV